MTTATLPELIAAAEQMAADTHATFGHLMPGQLNWKPNPEQWSIGQCFDHLRATKQPYFQIIEQVLAGTKPSTIWEKLPFWSSFLGKQFIKAMLPENARKVKTRPLFAPSASAVDAQIIQTFIAQERRWIETIKRTASIDTEKIIITSPVAAVVTYSLLDAIRLASVHERRHFQQAERVMRMAEFPS
jgi:DinB superfamily